MRRALAILLAFAAAGAGAQALAPPADLARLERGVVHAGLPTRRDPTQTFELYLPAAFDPARSWPLLLVFDPRSRGRLAAEIFVPAAERWGWIVASSNNTLSDGPFAPNLRAVNAMFPDLVERLPLDPRRLYAAGFSGGAVLAWVVGQQTGRLAGVISVGGRPAEGLEERPPEFALWATAGTDDFNYHPTRRLDELAARGQRAHRLEYFEGGHTWFGAGDAARALAWLEVVAMREGRRPTDLALIERLFAEDLAGAEGQLAAGAGPDALRRFRAVADTFRGLMDVAAVERRAAALDADPAVRRAIEQETRAAGFEQSARLRLAGALARLRDSETVPPLARLEADLDLRRLLDLAAETGPRGSAARRVLAAVRAHFGFYLVRDLFAAGDHARAVPALRIATRVAPDDAALWYNLACAQARTGRPADALASLDRALDLGLPRPTQLETDPDLASLRADAAFASRVERARAAERP